MKKTIVCFGDSNTWGYNAVNESRFAEEVRWTGRLASMLGDNFRVIEEGLSGRTSVIDDPLFEGLNGLTYIDPCLRSHSPLDLVIIMLGTNDTKERFSLTSYNIAQGILRIAQKAKQSITGINQQSPEVLIISPPRIGGKYRHATIGDAMGDGCAEKSAHLATHLEKLIDQEQFHFLDATSIPMNEIDYMHLDEGGHKLLAQLVFDKLHQILLT